MDGTDINKKHAKNMEGLEFVKNGYTGGIAYDYNDDHPHEKEHLGRSWPRRELVNFLYYKISKEVSILLMPVKGWMLAIAVPDPFRGGNRT